MATPRPWLKLLRAVREIRRGHLADRPTRLANKSGMADKADATSATEPARREVDPARHIFWPL